MLELLPDPRVVDFAGIQRNFDDVVINFAAVKASVVTVSGSVSSLSSSLSALTSVVAGKVASVTGSGGVAASGSTNVALTVDPTMTSSAAVPTTAKRVQLSGYRTITAAGQAGTTALLPLTLDDYFVELASTYALTTIYLPSATASGQFAGKIYLIRNGRNKAVTLNGPIGVLKTTATTASIGPGYTLMVVNTGSKWRVIDFRGGYTLGGVA